MSYHAFRGLGEGGCPPCTILFGGDCVPCPEGADMPECASCADGQLIKPEPWYEGFWGDVLIGAVVTVGVTVASTVALKRLRVRA